MSLIDYKGNQPLEIIPKHKFHRANKTQVDKIKETLNSSIHSLPCQIYEYDITQEVDKDTGDKTYKRSYLPPKLWKYWVISFEKYNTEIPDLSLAASLLKNDLEFGFTVIAEKLNGEKKQFAAVGLPGNTAYSFYYSDFHGIRSTKQITKEEILSIGDIYYLIKERKDKYSHIAKAFQRWNDLKSLPRSSDMLIIGLFSVIECLITHKPYLKDSSDSLTHQVKTKLPLLRKHFRRDIDYSNYFNMANEEKVWKRLYEFRSRIVHGENSNIEGTFKILKNKSTVINFLNECVKLLLLISLDEPILVSDLQKC